jgi:hypothetical protein
MSLKTSVMVSAVLGGLVLGGVAVAPAFAEEAKVAITATSIMNMFSRPIESREAAFDQALREEGPRPPGSPTGEVVGEGTVRYGRTSITVKNPCPPGHDDTFPKPLPGRRR